LASPFSARWPWSPSRLLSTRAWASPLRYAGQNSIAVYLAFFLPMAATRTALLKFAPGLDLGLVALIVTTAGVITPLILFSVVKDTPFRFLFKRPAWAKLEPSPAIPVREQQGSRNLVPAE
jgi:uncharacterized membrane protein YcfT